MSSQNIPCSDVAEKTTLLQWMGYQVNGSDPAPGMPGFCTLRYQFPAAAPVASANAFTAGLAPAKPAVSAPALEPLQKRAAQAIVNIFETGDVRGRYGQVTLIPGDSGHLTFGRSQTTLASGNLGRLVATYCGTPNARLAPRLKPYVSQLNDRLTELDRDLRLHNLLRATADDPVMHDVQDAFFDKTYWQPAVDQAAAIQIRSALGLAVVYDSTIHGSWGLVRDRTIDQFGHVETIGEENWIKAYIQTRGAWLANHERADLRRTTYRMTALKALADQGNWALELPLAVRGKEISLETLLAQPADYYDGPALGSRIIAVTTPLTRGADVRLLQLALSDADIPVDADGIFGSGSATALKQFQAQKNQAQSGVADLALLAQVQQAT
jgi:chitosanase